MQRVFVDTNVLFPFSVMDLMLALTEDGVHELLWTEVLLGEWEDVVTRDHGRAESTAVAIINAIREFFADSEVPEANYLPLVAEMPGNDPDDRIHMAAAIAGEASAIVTWNRKDFPAKSLAEHGLEVLDPDTYLCALADEFPDEIRSTLTRLTAAKRRPQMSTTQVLNALDKAGVPQFAAQVRRSIDR